MGPHDKPRRTSHSTSHLTQPYRSTRCRRGTTMTTTTTTTLLQPLLLLLLVFAVTIVQTGPVIRSRRMIREIYVENSAANAGAAATAPATIPESYSSAEASGDSDIAPVADFVARSDMCLHDGSYVERSTISCEKKHGCRAIQKTGECCPDFQCECQKDGKTYANGEKLFDPNTPCRSCYCQGGEVTCSEVSCYKRNDCDPKYIPGRCCPEYDNCPPLEHFKLSESSGAKDGKQETNEVNGPAAQSGAGATTETEDLATGHQKQSPSTTSPAASTTTTTSTTVTTTALPAPSHDNPLGIKIKEITKAEEIRLTDNRPPQTPEPAPSVIALAHSEELVNLEHLDVHVPDDDGENGTKIVRHTETADGHGDTNDVSTSASSESGVPQWQGAATSAENRVESNESSTSGAVSESEEWLNVKEMTADASTWAPAPAPSTTTPAPASSPSTSDPTEEEDEDRNQEAAKKPSKQDNGLPAVVQIGDKLVIVDHNQPKPITVIQVEEVEGLQRGEDDTVYDQEMYTERSPVASETGARESSKKLKLHQAAEPEPETLSTQADSSGSYETVWHGTGSTELVDLTSEEIYDTQHYTEGPDGAGNDTLNATVSSELDSVSKEDFLHIGPSKEPAKLQAIGKDVDQTTTVAPLTGSSDGYSGSDEGSTTISDLAISLSTEASGDGAIYDTHFYTEEPAFSSEEVKWQGSTASPTAAEVEASTPGSTYAGHDHHVPIAEELVTHGKTYIEDDEHDLIQPGFQPIPEDFSLPQRDQAAHEMGDEMMDQHQAPVARTKSEKQQNRILAEVLDVLTSKNGTTTTDRSVESSTEGAVGGGPSQEETSNSPAWLKEDPQPQLRSPGEPLLIPEWERLNRTGAGSTNSSEEELDGGSGENSSGGVASAATGPYHLLKMGSDEYVDGSLEEATGHEDSASTTVAAAPLKAASHSEREEDDEDDDNGGEQAKSKPSSGSSASSLLDIDSPADAATEQSDSVKHNPKNDVESLKYDEDENNATADEAIPKKVQQLEPTGHGRSNGQSAPTITSV
ncbi:serine-rich adhesin for platelets-like [Anopheles albimanus]|uniref:VWFC domain-containing protein n=1 Tax=Anopheles albimanus TaxID=7167 RepID=A0A8W7K859_ANOAL|nr:serine-rich adhesin for platelets-like [Anopheles albimanus]XP_035775041.1 serine-rich adhesin for platelets-like [Anopheles albimanus]